MISPKLQSLAFFASGTYMYATERCSALSIQLRCWNIKINEDTTQSIFFSHRLTPPEVHLTLKRWNIAFVNHVKYLWVIFDKKLPIKMIETEAFRTFIRVYSIFKSWVIKL
jgi:hypothetical protein